MKILIGSSAIKHWFPDFNRIPKDIDYAVKDKHSYESSKGIEYLVNPILFKYTDSEILEPNLLYTLKISHCFWSLENKSWDKHIWDIQFLKGKGCKFIKPLFDELFNYWEELHGKRKASDLNMSAEEFFDNAIDFPIKHDDVHEILIQHPYFEKQKTPTYTKILKKGAEVDVCMDKFEKLTEKEKFNVVFEEVAVMSIENRFPKKMYYKEKYSRMLKKFITSHCKVEEGIWIIQNHKELMTNIPFNYEEFINQNILETV